MLFHFLALNLYYLNGDVKGDVLRFQSPDFNDGDYTIHFHSTRLMLDLAFTVASWRNYAAYVLTGVGPSVNHLAFASRFDETLGCELSDVDVFSHNPSSIAYDLGAGLTYTLGEHSSIFIEYLYTGLRNLRLGNSIDAGTSLHPSHFDLDSQTVFFGMHYRF